MTLQFKFALSSAVIGACVLTVLPTGPATASEPQTPTAQYVIKVSDYTSTLTVTDRNGTVHSKQVTSKGMPDTSSTSVITPDAFPPSGYHDFTPQSPSWSFGDSSGNGSEQITYGASSISEAWGYRLSSAVASTVDGDVVEDAALFHSGTKIQGYGSHTEPATYHFHGSKGGLTTAGTYQTDISMGWFTKNGGEAQLTATWNWIITLV